MHQIERKDPQQVSPHKHSPLHTCRLAADRVVRAVVDDNVLEVGRVMLGNGGEAAHVHRESAVAIQAVHLTPQRRGHVRMSVRNTDCRSRSRQQQKIKHSQAHDIRKLHLPPGQGDPHTQTCHRDSKQRLMGPSVSTLGLTGNERLLLYALPLREHKHYRVRT